MTLPSDFQMPIPVDVFFILMYDMYIFALKLLIEMLISCIFVNLNCENFLESFLQ